MMRRRGRPGLVGTMARTAVIAGTASTVSGNVHRRQQASAAAAAPAAPPAAPASVGIDLDQLAKLGELHQAGVLTDDEFAAAKAKVLG